MPRATDTALIILVAHAAFAAAQRGGDTAFRIQAAAVLQGQDTLPYLSERRIALVARALRTIHTQFPQVDDIVPGIGASAMTIEIADSVAKQIVARSGARKPAKVDPMFWDARVTHTGIPALDSLNTRYGARRILLRVADFGTELYLDFGRPVNIPVIQTAYERVPQVAFVMPQHRDVYTSVTLLDKRRALDFVFARGVGDCPAGCIESDDYYVAYDTVTRTAAMERERRRVGQWGEPVAYWNIPSRVSITPYPTFDSLVAGTHDSQWWYRAHAVQVLAFLLGPAIGPSGGDAEPNIERFTALKRATLARRQEAYGAIIDRLTDPDLEVAKAALGGLRSASRRKYGADRAGLAAWQRWLRDLPNHRPPLEIRFINVGHGDAILIRQGSLAALIDAGLPNDSIVERLRAMGVDSLQLFVATHNHDDHIGSAGALLSALPVRLFIDNGTRVGTPAEQSMQDAVRKRGIPQLHDVRRTITLGDARVEIIPPPAGMDAVQSNHSLSVRIERGAFRALLTGDGERSEVAALAAHERLAHVAVLKAPNHGETNAVSDVWLRRLTPDVVVVSSAEVGWIADAGRRYASDRRIVPSTRYDGDIVVMVYDDGTYAVQSRAGVLR